MAWRWAALLVLVAGCYNPRSPEGAPCDTARECPSPQSCVLGRCSSHDAQPADAEIPPDAPEEIDAAVIVDAQPDALILPCTAEGLVGCGTPIVFECGGHCWVRCSNSTVQANASAACAGWQGALGQIDDALEQSCVGARVGSNTWIGLVQIDGVTAPAAGWVWNTAANPVGFANWQSGKPDDRDGVESRTEQCAMFQSDDRWDDVACGEQHPFLCER